MDSSVADLANEIYTATSFGSVKWQVMSSRLKFKNGSTCRFDSSLDVYADREGGEVTVGYPSDLFCYKSQPDWKKGNPSPDWIVKGSDVQLPAQYCPVGKQGRPGESFCWEPAR
jgi:hypothetical protein